MKVTGVPREALVGTDFSDYFTDPDQARAGYRQVFAQGSVTDYPLTIRHRDGRLTDVVYNASVYTDAAGHVLGVFAAARDVTAQKAAEAEIARQREMELEQLVERAHSRELLDAVFQTLPDLICIAGMDGYFRVLNPAWEHTFGWTTAELCAQPYIEFVHPDDRQPTLDARRRPGPSRRGGHLVREPLPVPRRQLPVAAVELAAARRARHPRRQRP